MKKESNKIIIDFSDAMSAEDVTGSQYRVIIPADAHHEEYQFLVDCGGYQGSTVLDDYRVNHRNLSYSVKRLQAIFLTHVHYDHVGLTPRIVKEGFRGPIYCPKGSARLIRTMWKDCAHINGKNAEYLSQYQSHVYQPLYDEDDVSQASSQLQELDFGTPYAIRDDITLELFHAGHILSSAQFLFTFTYHNHVRKVGFTGDIGNPHIKKNFVEPMQQLPKCDVLIGECTYGSFKKHSVTMKDRKKDQDKIRCLVNQTCLEKKGKLIFPVFALDRSVEVLCELYKIYKDDANFHVPVLFDTKLGISYLKDYQAILEDEEKALLEEVLQWKNLTLINEYPESLSHQKRRNTSEIVLASSGMAEQGRIVSWLENYVSDTNSHLVFCGYSTDNSLASILKEGKQRKVKVNGKNVSANIPVTQLHSFSSHASHNALMEYYTNTLQVNERIVLVHGDREDKLSLTKELQEALSKKNKSTKVVTSTGDMKIKI